MPPARSASTAPKGRKKLARGNAPGPASRMDPSPEGAAEGLGHCETGEKLLASILAKRECDHHGVGKYRQPVEPAIDNLPQLPSHWTWSSPEQLSAASRNSMAIGPFGSNLKVPDYREEGVPLVFVRHIRSESFAETHYVTPEKAEELASHAVAGGDLLITKMGEPPGDTAIYPVGAPDAIITADCIKWRLAPAGLDPKFFKYALRTETTKKQVAKRTRGVAQKKVSLERFKDIALPLPPLPEQRRIVARIEELFSRLDAGVAALRHAKAQLQRYRQSVLAAAVTGQLTQAWREQHPDTEPAEDLLARILDQRRESWNGRGKYKEPSGFSGGNPFETPTTWALTTFEQVSERVTVGHVGSMKDEYVESGVPFLRGQNVRANRFDPKGLRFVSPEFHKSLAKSTIHGGDIAVTRSGDVGIACVIPEDLGEANCSDLVLIQGPILIDPNYAAYYLNSLGRRLVQKGKVGVAITHFNTKSVAEMPLPLPPLAEQHQIVAEVEARTTAIDHLEAELDRQITRSNRLRQSTLAAAFTGSV